MATASKSILFVVPAQPTPIVETISQAEVTLLLLLRGRLHQLESQVERAEASIKQRLEQGASVELGDHTATLATGYRRNVSWKSVAERLAYRFKLDGKAYVAHVLAATRPTPVVSLEIPKLEVRVQLLRGRSGPELPRQQSLLLRSPGSL